MKKATKKLAQTEASINGYLDALELDNTFDVIGKSDVVKMLRSLLMLVNEAQTEVNNFSSNSMLCDSVCPKCGDTGRCEPRTLADPDGQECNCGQTVR